MKNLMQKKIVIMKSISPLLTLLCAVNSTAIDKENIEERHYIMSNGFQGVSRFLVSKESSLSVDQSSSDAWLFSRKENDLYTIQKIGGSKLLVAGQEESPSGLYVKEENNVTDGSELWMIEPVDVSYELPDGVKQVVTIRNVKYNSLLSISLGDTSSSSESKGVQILKKKEGFMKMNYYNIQHNRYEPNGDYSGKVQWYLTAAVESDWR